jgi:hypothetical protein
LNLKLLEGLGLLQHHRRRRHCKEEVTTLAPIDAESAPVACTLGLSDLRTRMSEIASLNSQALKQHECRDLELELVYVFEARERVYEMVRKERECCAFLDFDIHEDANNVRLVIRAPESTRSAVALILASFLGKAVTALSCRC